MDEENEKAVLQQLKDLIDSIEKKRNAKLLWSTLGWVLTLLLIFAIPIFLLAIFL